MMQLMEGGRAGGLVPIAVQKEDVPDVAVLNIIHACLQSPAERPTFKIIEEKLSLALKRCQTVKNKETKTNEYLTAQDGTLFTSPSVKLNENARRVEEEVNAAAGLKYLTASDGTQFTLKPGKLNEDTRLVEEKVDAAAGLKETNDMQETKDAVIFSMSDLLAREKRMKNGSVQ